MKIFVDALKMAQDASGAGSRAIKIQAIATMGRCATAVRLLVEGMSPYRVFGVKKFDMPKAFAPVNYDDSHFFRLLDDLHDRVLTGNDARREITDVLSLYTKETAQVLRLVLLKDLKGGFSADTVNEVLGDVVPAFDVMLAGKIDAKYKWSFPTLAEIKYDGTRTIAICENRKVTYFSRSGKPADHLNGLFDDELCALEEEKGEPIIVDGEALGKDFTETMNAKKSTNLDAKNNLNFYAFDMMTLAEWKAKECSTPQMIRSELLEAILAKTECTKIIKSEYKICENYDEVYAYYALAVENGWEGLIIKDMNALYEWDRSKSWMKWKPVNTYDGKIIGFFEGKAGTVLEGTLGGIIVEGEDENGTPWQARCGSGFTFKDREEIWNNKDKYLLATVELEAQEMTKSEGNELHSLRFPVFIKIRTDK